MILSNRLKVIVDYVDFGQRVLDIGTDHGFVPIFLAKHKGVKYIVASDISKNSLEKSRDEILRLKLQENIFLRLGNGLEVVEKGEVDTVIIAGMGGYLIKNLLVEELEKVKSLDKLILQPMQNSEVLREYLYKNKFEIISEKIIYEDGRYFEIIVSKYGKDNSNIDEIYYEIPKKLLDEKDETLKNYLKYKINNLKEIIKKIKVNSKENKKLIEIENKIKFYEGLLWK